MRVLFSLAFVWLLAACPVLVGAVGLPAGTTIQVVATADYTDSFNQPRNADPASVTLKVVQVAGAAIEADHTGYSAVPGEVIHIPLRIYNTGNGPDSTNLTISSMRGWQTALIYDTNADGIHQSSEQWAITNTGTMIADGYCPCFARVTVPSTATSGDKIIITARSSYNPAQGSAAAVLEVPSAGKTATAITAQVSPHTPIALQAVTLTGRVSPSGAYPLTITLTDPLGAASPSNITTSADGSFEYVFTPQRSGVYQMETAFAGDSNFASSSTSTSVSVSKTPASITLISSPKVPCADDCVTVSGIITPGQQSTILMECVAPDNSVTQQQITTDAQGAFEWHTYLSAEGVWRLTASYAGNATCAAASKEILVSVTDPGSERHTVQINSGPTLSPSTIVSAGSTQCSIDASDSQSHSLIYRWSDGGAGGTFTPSADMAQPVYTAKSNLTGHDVQVTLTCTVWCSVDSQVTTSGSAALVVRPVASAPRVLSVSPADGAGCVALDAPIMIQFDKQMDRAATQQAILVPPGLLLPEYEWSSDSKALTIRHQGLLGETEYMGIIGAGAADAAGTQLAEQYAWTFTTTHYLAFQPKEISVEPGHRFTTPPIVINDPTLPASVTLFVTVPEGFSVDTGSGTTCVEPGADAGQFFADWHASARELIISAVIDRPALGAEIVRGITLTAPNDNRCASLLVNDCPGLTVRVGSAIPGDFNNDGVVNISDASLFVAQWSRWHRSPAPVFSPAADGPFDLAPRTSGTWPDWTPIGDGKINISDASAFIECWVAATCAVPGTRAQAYSAPISAPAAETVVRDEGDRLIVIVESAPNGRFECEVRIPADAYLDAATEPSGNLAFVQRGNGVGTFFFTEFDEAERVVRICGNTAGRGPHTVAVIQIQR